MPSGRKLQSLRRRQHHDEGWRRGSLPHAGVRIKPAEASGSTKHQCRPESAAEGGRAASMSRRRGPSRPRLRVTVSDEWGRQVAADGLDRWLAGVAPARADGTVNIALVSDSRLRALNRQYLGRNYATDVLSFPVSDSDHLFPVGRESPTSDASIRACLGEIVIARGVARRQALRARHSPRTELRVLALHGLLHLLGYDHESDAGAMARVERRLRTKEACARVSWNAPR